MLLLEYTSGLGCPTVQQQRPVLPEPCSCSLQAFYQYGAFCLRTGARSQADTCLRQALSLDNRHLGGLQALLFLSLHWLQSGEEESTEKAEVLGHSLKDLDHSSALSWALLTMVYRAGGEGNQEHIRYSWPLHRKPCHICFISPRPIRMPMSSSLQQCTFYPFMRL
jgi:hypothetical protein